MKDRPPVSQVEGNLFDRRMERGLAAGSCASDSASAVVKMYVDGAPKDRGKHKLSRAALDLQFWSSTVVQNLSDAQWGSEIMLIALTRYLGQERVASVAAMRRAAECAPKNLIRAARHSRLVLRPDSARRTELDQVSVGNTELTELCAVLDIFSREHRACTEDLQRAQNELKSLTAFELLIYASLYAFEYLVPTAIHTSDTPRRSDAMRQLAWDAINDLLIWRLGTAEPGSLTLTDTIIGQSIRDHLTPSISVGESDSSEHFRLRRSFESLLAAQIKLNEFVSRSADAFSYDDGIRFVRNGDRLEIEEVDPVSRLIWDLENRKLEQLDRYWLNRAIDAFASSDLNGRQIGSEENAQDNRVAYIRAMQCHIRLTEVYGVGGTVTTPSGTRADVFQAVLALLLMSAFYLRDFIAAFSVNLHMTGHWRSALGVMAMEGLQDRLQLRLPLTWSDRNTKISNIVGWTVSSEFPQGSKHAASAILDLWTNDLGRLSEKLIRGEPGLHPELFELPFLGFGKVLVQLPWIVGLQNNSTAAINTLRRLGARRDEAKEEAHRIEKTLGQLFEYRGFRVAFNWEPADKEAGEIDLICALDGVVLVLEMKSTFVRRSQKEAWLHATTTLRKAGHQLSRKVRSVESEIAGSEALRTALSLSAHPPAPTIYGWIIDTSIERDHSRFDGFLKVSVEEILIALKDDRHLLRRPNTTLDGHSSSMTAASSTTSVSTTLYPDGFTGGRFVAAIETAAVWQEF